MRNSEFPIVTRQSSIGSSPIADHLPLVFPMVVADHAARIAGRKIGEVVTNGQLLAEVLLDAWRRYGYDLILVFADTMVEAEALGCKVAIPEDDNPFLVASPGIQKVVADATGNTPKLGARMSVILEATGIAVRTAGPDVPVLTGMKGPFSLACFLGGVEEFLVALRAAPEKCHQILQFCLALQQMYADAIVKAGGIPFIGDPLASGDIISRRDFDTFALPYLQRLVQHVQRTATRSVGLHVCGETTDRLASLRDSGADILSLDEVDLQYARETLGKEIILMGNVPTQLIAAGTPDQVRQAARECLAKGGPRMILASACDIPAAAPVANVQAIVDALRQT